MNKLIISLVFFLTASCSQSAFSARKIQISKCLENMTVHLEKIQTREDLKIREKKIKIEIDLLAKTLISMKKDFIAPEEIEELVLSTQKKTGFEKEFMRVMAIDGCLEIYQNLSLDALYLLDAFERKLQFPAEKNLKVRKIEDS
jgi:hypothetical protein